MSTGTRTVRPYSVYTRIADRPLSVYTEYGRLLLYLHGTNIQSMDEFCTVLVRYLYSTRTGTQGDGE